MLQMFGLKDQAAIPLFSEGKAVPPGNGNHSNPLRDISVRDGIFGVDAAKKNRFAIKLWSLVRKFTVFCFIFLFLKRMMKES
jgi:hypothetical protein